MVAFVVHRGLVIASILSIGFVHARRLNTQRDTSSNSSNSTDCRCAPGDDCFPTPDTWAQLNSSISGRLVNVVSSAAFCNDVSGGCTDAQWSSSTFRANIPGAMNQPLWEQDYFSDPPSVCFRNSSTTEPPANVTQSCGQGSGDVPLFAILAESASDIQAGVNFARDHNLRLAIKSSGHDYLGRSTARNSLLISTHKLQNISLVDNFTVGGVDQGSAVTIGSGVPLNSLYTALKAEGKIFVASSVATLAPAGGFVQGAGHSALSPSYGLAVDNVIEFTVVIASGDILTVNDAENSDLFWAMRGGGAGSWGVIISATFRVYPTFNAVYCDTNVTTSTPSTMGSVATVHARHIFDLDPLRAGQYFWVVPVDGTGSNSSLLAMQIQTIFPNNASVEAAEAALQPFIDDASNITDVQVETACEEQLINDMLFAADDSVGTNIILGSRLFPESLYETSPEAIGDMYVGLLENGTLGIFGNLVAGGKVAENANISMALNPAWRTAKTHVFLAHEWADSATIPDVIATQHAFSSGYERAALVGLAGEDSGSYTNEGDRFEPNLQVTFYGSTENYEKLEQVKSAYDPEDLFLVTAGVGSERWDEAGFCRLA
ncbi:FAD-binding domain-containing protein [Lentinula edodes]|nr:FAD-binding domain-containing protein [Lentinula edodes]